MKRFVYKILFLITTWMVSSCRTTETAKTTSTQNRQTAGYTLDILVHDSGTAIDRLLDGIHQSASVTDMQVNTNDNFLKPDCEFLVFITPIPDKQINDIRSALNAIPEVKLIKISKN